MICPFCGDDDDKVIDSRAAEAGSVIRRRRECTACGRRFTTYERVEQARRLSVVKRDGSRVPFDPEKLLAGIQAACGKRPIPEEQKTSIVEAVEEELHREFEREVPSAEVGRRVMARLRDIDGIAYIRYASEYYAFRDLDELAREVSNLKERVRDLPNQQSLF